MKNYKIDKKYNSLKNIFYSLNNGELKYSNYIETLIERVKLIEPLIKSFVQQPDVLINNLKSLLTIYKRTSLCSFSDPSLKGIPIGVKDIYHVDGFTTRAGSKLPVELFNLGEGFLVKKLKELKASVIGKTVTTEFAYFAAGPTRNPNNIEFSPGGSSSGSAAAVAAGIVPLAFGTQTIGSIIRPAAFCGVVGFKPTQNRIPTDGIVQLSPTLDQIGYFTMDVESASFVSSLLFTFNKKEKDKYKICIPAGYYLQKSKPEILNLFNKYLQNLKSDKIEIVEIHLLEDIDDVIEKHMKLLSAEAARVHSAWFEKYRSLYHPKTAEMLERGMKTSENEINEILTFREKFKHQLSEFFVQQNVDAILTPSTIELPPRGLEYTGSPVMSLPWTFAGFPSINIPAGYVENDLPFGVQLIGKEYDDEVILLIAKIIEERN